MSLITIIQRTCRRVGLAAPSSAIGNTDENIIRMIELANEEGEELATRGSWQALRSESTFVSVATESQGAMTTLAGASFDHIANETIWNRTQDRPWHPVDDVTWQRMKSNGITGPYNYFRVRGGNLIVQPTPTAGETIAFEWASKNWCQSSVGAGQTVWTADTDTSKLDERIMIMGLVWRWKQAQGLEYSEDFSKYENMVSNALAQDGAKPKIRMGKIGSSEMNIPEGSWTL